jgi:ParB family transcriptional regulator, chromosome partitioning protein
VWQSLGQAVELKESLNMSQPPEVNFQNLSHQYEPVLSSLDIEHLVHEDKSNIAFLRNLPLFQLRPMVDQPRQSFNEGALEELAQSIKTHGLLQPLLAVQIGPEQYQIAGERRFRAAKKIGLSEVPVLVRTASKRVQLELALVENIQREELNPMDEAFAIHKLITEHLYTQEVLATRLGKDRSTLANAIRLLSLPPEIQKDLRDRRLSAGHGRALCGLDNKKVQLKIRDLILEKKLSVRQTEDLIKAHKKVKSETKLSPVILSPDLRHLCEDLKSQLQMKVKISGSSERGKLEIEYFSVDDLQKIRDLLMGSSDF